MGDGLINIGFSKLIIGCPDNSNKYYQEYTEGLDFRDELIALDETGRFSSTTFQDFTTYDAVFENNQLTISWTKVGIASFESCDLLYFPE